MKKLILLFLLPVVWLSASGQDRLEPASGKFGDSIKALIDYCPDNDPDKALAVSRYLMLPTGGPYKLCMEYSYREIALKEYMEKYIGDYDEYYATGRINPDDIKPIYVYTKKGFDGESATILTDLLSSAVFASRFNSVKNIFDGTLYYFTTRYGLKSFTGYAHSPAPDTNTGELVKIMDEIVDMVKKEGVEEPISFDSDMQARIISLTAKFKDLR